MLTGLVHDMDMHMLMVYGIHTASSGRVALAWHGTILCYILWVSWMTGSLATIIMSYGMVFSGYVDLHPEHNPQPWACCTQILMPLIFERSVGVRFPRSSWPPAVGVLASVGEVAVRGRTRSVQAPVPVGDDMTQSSAVTDPQLPVQLS